MIAANAVSAYHLRTMPRAPKVAATPMEDLPKAYEAKAHEDAIYQEWERSGAFKPQGKGDPYCIVMPPPNRTGTLHIGHAMMLAVEDLLIRFHRMQGKRALWIPGTDHAAIATQVKVEQLLMKQGMKNPREELGREKFLEKVVEFADESATTIRNQVRKMGSSCDWSREAYTLDEERNRAVNEMFKMMYEDGIIERGYRVVNWDPQFQTTLSDDEVETKDVKAKLLTFKYDSEFPITISTTRPETKFGDTAVAVHPDDKRYKKFVGKTFEPVFCGKKLSIKVIADEAVDPEFGTGALGVTPAHSMIDAEIAERHALPTVPVIGRDGKMLEGLGEFSGLTVVEARKKIEEHLADEGLLEKVEEVDQALPIAQRGGAAVEQLPMKQWFIRVNKKFVLRQDALGKWKKGKEATLKELMIEAVQSGQTKIVPERFDKTYFHWINNLRDWCISRQIWFGHRIPVWYNGDDVKVSVESPGAGWEQDPDTLDTWFSSGLWTFSTLGWPDVKEWKKNRDFHPTAVLETGYDILFFWVARMILMSTYALGEVPFKDVYLHGLVRDEQGRKMSKSLGNVLDPLDLIPKYGTDAVRLSLVMGTTPGQDTKLSEPKIEGFRNFTNKLWNISRFILMQIGGVKGGEPDPKTLADRWILARLSEVSSSVTKKIETYQFSSAGEELRDFTWGDLADWYLEIAKIEKGKEAILSHILETILKLWHPFMPFVTEHIWKTAGFEGALITAEWPRHVIQKDILEGYIEFERVRDIVSTIRRLRLDSGIEPIKQIEVVITGPKDMEEQLKNISMLTRATVSIVSDIPQGMTTMPWQLGMIGLNVAGAVDLEKEKSKIEKEIAETEKYLASLTQKLKNKEFTSKAPEKVVGEMKAKQAEAEGKLVALKERLETLG